MDDKVALRLPPNTASRTCTGMICTGRWGLPEGRAPRFEVKYFSLLPSASIANRWADYPCITLGSNTKKRKIWAKCALPKILPLN